MRGAELKSEHGNDEEREVGGEISFLRVIHPSYDPSTPLVQGILLRHGGRTDVVAVWGGQPTPGGTGGAVVVRRHDIWLRPTTRRVCLSLVGVGLTTQLMRARCVTTVHRCMHAPCLTHVLTACSLHALTRYSLRGWAVSFSSTHPASAWE